MHIYKFSKYSFDGMSLNLRMGSQQIVLRPKSAQLLLFLLKNSGMICSKEYILNNVWSDSVVSEGVVYDAIKELRQVFNDDPRCSTYIQTTPKQGYQWLQPFRLIDKRKNKLFSDKKSKILISILATALLVGVFHSSIKDATSSKTRQENGQHVLVSNNKPLIVVLPFINKTDRKNDLWVTAGLMDMLENSLAYQASFNTYSSHEILNLYKHYSISSNENLTESQLSRIIAATNADFVVETSFHYASPKADSLFSSKTIVHAASDNSKVEKRFNNLSPGKLISQISIQLIDRFIRNSFITNFSKNYQYDEFVTRLFAEGNQALLSRDFVSARRYFEIILDKNPKNVIARYKLAIAEIEMGNTKTSQNILLSLSNESRFEFPEMLRGYAYTLLGKTYYYQNNFELADRYYSKALQIFTDKGIRKSIAWINILKSRVFLLKENYDESRKLLYEALSIYKQTNNLLGQGWTLEFLANLEIGINRLDLAEVLLDRSISIRKRAGNQLGVAAALVKKGNLFLQSDNPRALRLYLEAHAIYRLINDKIAEKKALVALINYWISNNNLEKAEYYSDILTRNAETLQNVDMQNKASEVRTKINNMQFE